LAYLLVDESDGDILRKFAKVGDACDGALGSSRVGQYPMASEVSISFDAIAMSQAATQRVEEQHNLDFC
jgi:hypothetical protein